MLPDSEVMDLRYAARPEAGLDERKVIMCEPAGQATLAAVQVEYAEELTCKHESLSSKPSLTYLVHPGLHSDEGDTEGDTVTVCDGDTDAVSG